MDHKADRGAIVFDFDGTLVDSFPVALEIFYDLTHTDALEQTDMMRLRGMTMLQVAKELRIPAYAIPFLLIRGRRMMRRRMHDVRLIADMKAAIEALHKTHKLFILSSNSPHNIWLTLTKYELADYFSGIHGNVPLLGKARALRRLLKHYRLDSKQTWYVGDEARDLDAAQKNDMRAVAVSWGYNNIHVLREHKPTALVFTTEELVRCFDNNIQ
jgi:phosphoglycolate phosphatase